MNNLLSPKERGLLKGALRRIFSRSDLRRQALDKHNITFQDPNRPRVTKWSFCGECGCIEPRYLMEVDHISPVIKVSETLDSLTIDQLIARLWCSIDNLSPICKPCHKAKSKVENKERRAFKRGENR